MSLSQNRLLSVILMVLVVIGQLPTVMACEMDSHNTKGHSAMMMSMDSMNHDQHSMDMSMDSMDCCDDTVECACPMGSCGQTSLVQSYIFPGLSPVDVSILPAVIAPTSFTPSSLYRPPASV